jgi:hypothetical protein
MVGYWYTSTWKNVEIEIIEYEPSQELGLNDYIIIRFVEDGFDPETRYTLANITPILKAYLTPAVKCSVLQPN